MTLIEFGLSHQNQGTFLETKIFGECINLKIIIKEHQYWLDFKCDYVWISLPTWMAKLKCLQFCKENPNQAESISIK